MTRPLRWVASLALSMVVSGCAVNVDHTDVFTLRERQVPVAQLALPEGFDRSRVSELSVQSSGRRYLGYRLASAQPRRAVVFFTGNGYGASSALPRLAALFGDPVTELFVLSYGQTDESPPQVQQVYGMAEALVGSAAQASKVSAGRVIAVGHSLGGWVALHLAATQRVGCVVVAGTGTTVTDAASALLPRAAAAVVSLRPDDDVSQLDNVAQARRVTVPALVIGSKADETMPARFAAEIFANLGNRSASELLLSESVAHGAYFRDPQIAAAVDAFIRRKCERP